MKRFVLFILILIGMSSVFAGSLYRISPTSDDNIVEYEVVYNNCILVVPGLARDTLTFVLRQRDDSYSIIVMSKNTNFYYIGDEVASSIEGAKRLFKPRKPINRGEE